MSDLRPRLSSNLQLDRTTEVLAGGTSSSSSRSPILDSALQSLGHFDREDLLLPPCRRSGQEQAEYGRSLDASNLRRKAQRSEVVLVMATRISKNCSSTMEFPS